MYVIGFDIGGTKCAAILVYVSGGSVNFLERRQIATAGSWQSVLDKLISFAKGFIDCHSVDAEHLKCGISCGGPLDSGKGLILSPPNLPGWDDVPICEYIKSKLNVSAVLMNDADACAVAEWKFGSGRGSSDMIFLTFGTGLGAGLILNGRLYSGANGMAGEVGHIRLSGKGPVGYNKQGSFEGFCSGGGIAKQAKTYIEKLRVKGRTPLFAQDKDFDSITAKDVAEAANANDPDAVKIMNGVGKYFGKGLSVIIDILNPEIIVVGSIFVRCGHLIVKSMQKEIDKEALSRSAKVCKIVPAALSERIGDYGAVCAALAGK